MSAVFVVSKAPGLAPAPSAPRVAPKARSRHTKNLRRARPWLEHLATRSDAHFGVSSDGTLRRAQDLRRALHAPHSRGLRPGIKASLAPLRRMEASRVGCDGQLVDLRFVPCEVRPEKVFHFLDEWRLVEKMRFCITIAISSARSAFTS